MGLQGMILWVPVEKLFMSEIGFTPASVGVMAAAYAAVVPLLEVPSGVLADRWSRSRIMVLACVALLVSSTIGGLSQSVATYVVAAVALGGYFALSSGTVDSIVYDTVLEETGSSELYETWIGRVRMVESAAFVVSALAGGVLAGGDVGPHHLFRDLAVRGRGDRRVPAFRGAPPAPGRRADVAAQPSRA